MAFWSKFANNFLTLGQCHSSDWVSLFSVPGFIRAEIPRSDIRLMVTASFFWVSGSNSLGCLTGTECVALGFRWHLWPHQFLVSIALDVNRVVIAQASFHAGCRSTGLQSVSDCRSVCAFWITFVNNCLFPWVNALFEDCDCISFFVLLDSLAQVFSRMGDCIYFSIAVLAKPFDFQSDHAQVWSKLPMSRFTNRSLTLISISIEAIRSFTVWPPQLYSNRSALWPAVNSGWQRFPFSGVRVSSAGAVSLWQNSWDALH